MKKSFAHYFARSVIFLLLSAFLLLASACSSQQNGKPSGTSEAPSDLGSGSSGAVPSDEIPSGTSEVPSDRESENSDVAPDSENAMSSDAALNSEDTPLNSADIVSPNVLLNFLHIDSFSEYQKFMQSDEGSNIQISYEDIKGLGEFSSITVPGALLDDYSDYWYMLVDKNGNKFILEINHAYSESFPTIDSLRPMDPNQADLREIKKVSAKGFQYRQVGDWIYRYYSTGSFASIEWTVGQTQFSLDPFLTDLKTIDVEKQTGFFALFDQKRAIQTQQEMLKKCPVLQAKSKDGGIS